MHIELNPRHRKACCPLGALAGLLGPTDRISSNKPFRFLVNGRRLMVRISPATPDPVFATLACDDGELLPNDSVVPSGASVLIRSTTARDRDEPPPWC